MEKSERERERDTVKTHFLSDYKRERESRQSDAVTANTAKAFFAEIDRYHAARHFMTFDEFRVFETSAESLAFKFYFTSHGGRIRPLFPTSSRWLNINMKGTELSLKIQHLTNRTDMERMVQLLDGQMDRRDENMEALLFVFAAFAITLAS